MRSGASCFLVLLLWAHAPLASSGQTRVYFSALDKEEKPVPGLRESDFELRINGRPAPLESFHPGLSYTDKSIPLVAWILLDANPNINKTVVAGQTYAVQAIFDLFHPDSAIGVQLISDRAETLAPLAHNPVAIREAFAQFGGRRSELNIRRDDTVVVGSGGIMQALRPAMEEMDRYILSQPWSEVEIHRAIIIISDGNIDPYYKTKQLCREAAQRNVFLYPIFYPRERYGPWLGHYFDLALWTGGLGSVFGALQPGGKLLPLPRANTDRNAITFNFIHIARDLNGKYSFSAPDGKSVKLKCRVRGVKIRLPL